MTKWALGLATAALVVAKPVAAADFPEPQRQVLAVEREWVDAEVRRDAGTLRRLLHDQFTYTTGAGKPVNKARFISSVVDAADVVTSQDLSERTIVVDGDTAVVAKTATVRATAKGKPYTRAYRVTVTYVQRQDRWLALAEHVVPTQPASQ